MDHNLKIKAWRKNLSAIITVAMAAMMLLPAQTLPASGYGLSAHISALRAS